MKTHLVSIVRKIVLAGNKSFELTRDKEGKEWWLSIVERGHNYFTKAALSKKAAKWLLSVFSQVLRQRKITQETERDDFAFYIGQLHSNLGGTFIRIARHANSEGGKVSFLCIPEGDSIYGWKSFAEVLHELLESTSVLNPCCVQTHKNLGISTPQEPEKNQIHKNLNTQSHKNLNEPQPHKNLGRTQSLSLDSKPILHSKHLVRKFGDWSCAMVLDVGIRDPYWNLMGEMLSLVLENKEVKLFPFEGSKAIWFADSVEDRKSMVQKGSFEFDVGWEVKIAC